VVTAAASTRPSYEEHVPILEAIERGDPAAAQAAMEHHMTSAAERLRKTLSAEAGEGTT
jgi:GntR family transcriptional repressor for pyruvate dehydrogenase complex